MRRMRGEGGFTLIELLVTMALALVVFSAVMGVLVVFQRQDGYDENRNEAQDNARNAIDRLALDLRNVAAPVAGSTGSLEQVGPYDIVFQTISGGTVFGGQNATNAMRVRYCLDDSTPSSEKLWELTQTWTSSSPPAIPSTASCPGTVSPGSPTSWQTEHALVTNVTNENNSQNRPLFSCQSPGSSADVCASETTGTSQVKAVQVDLFENLNPGGQPGESELTDGIDLRNALSVPVASFTLSQVNNNYVVLDGTGSYDPNGQAITYQWYQGSSCASANAIAGATAQQYHSGSLSSGTYTFDLQVTNIGGLTSCAAAQTVKVS